MATSSPLLIDTRTCDSEAGGEGSEGAVAVGTARTVGREHAPQSAECSSIVNDNNSSPWDRGALRCSTADNTHRLDETGRPRLLWQKCVTPLTQWPSDSVCTELTSAEYDNITTGGDGFGFVDNYTGRPTSGSAARPISDRGGPISWAPTAVVRPDSASVSGGPISWAPTAVVRPDSASAISRQSTRSSRPSEPNPPSAHLLNELTSFEIDEFVTFDTVKRTGDRTTNIIQNVLPETGKLSIYNERMYAH